MPGPSVSGLSGSDRFSEKSVTSPWFFFCYYFLFAFTVGSRTCSLAGHVAAKRVAGINESKLMEKTENVRPGTRCETKPSVIVFEYISVSNQHRKLVQIPGNRGSKAIIQFTPPWVFFPRRRREFSLHVAAVRFPSTPPPFVFVYLHYHDLFSFGDLYKTIAHSSYILSSTTAVTVFADRRVMTFFAQIPFGVFKYSENTSLFERSSFHTYFNLTE